MAKAKPVTKSKPSLKPKKATPVAAKPKRPKLPPSPMSVAFRHIHPHWRYYMIYVEMAAKEGDEDMRKLLSSFMGLPPREQNSIMPESLCELAGIKPSVLFSAVCGKLWELGQAEANLITAVNYPVVIAKTAQLAGQKNGVKDREMFHRASGFLKSPAGPSIVFNPQTLITSGPGQTQTLLEAPAIPRLPSPESTAKRLEAATPAISTTADVEST